jgi:hypothetical protein
MTCKSNGLPIQRSAMWSDREQAPGLVYSFMRDLCKEKRAGNIPSPSAYCR